MNQMLPRINSKAVWWPSLPQAKQQRAQGLIPKFATLKRQAPVLLLPLQLGLDFPQILELGSPEHTIKISVLNKYVTFKMPFTLTQFYPN